MAAGSDPWRETAEVLEEDPGILDRIRLAEAEIRAGDWRTLDEVVPRRRRAQR
jgi:hypothetical protein